MNEENAKSRELIINLYQARKEKAECKGELLAVSEKFGQCGFYDIGSGNHSCCYMDGDMSRDEWCEICTEKQPVRERYRASCGKAGGALRSLLAHGKKLAEDQ